MTAALRNVAAIGSRSVRRTVRPPIFVVTSIAVPLILLALNAGALGPATSIEGFPAERYLDFALAVPFITIALFSAVTAGTAVAIDIESGVINRLALTPLGRGALLVGHVAGAMTIAMVSALAYLVVALAIGAELRAGPGGAVVLVTLTLLIALAFAGIGVAIGVHTGKAQAVQGVFPVLFVALYLSSATMPRDLIAVDWFREVATYDPVSYLVEGVRSLIITGWDGSALAKGFGCTIAIGVLSWTTAVAGMRSRMLRA